MIREVIDSSIDLDPFILEYIQVKMIPISVTLNCPKCLSRCGGNGTFRRKYVHDITAFPLSKQNQTPNLASAQIVIMSLPMK